jgi:hypothetical protein
VRRLALLLLVLPLAAACGGSDEKSAPATTIRADPGQAVVAAALRAAANDDRKALWNLLSTASRKRLGGFEAFRREGARALERALAPFAGEEPVPFVSQSVSAPFGVVAIRSGARALAFPLRHEHGAWRIETAGPLAFRILSPPPGSKGAVTQIAAEVRSPGVVDDAVVWVDGRLVLPTLAPAQGKATVFASLPRPLSAGRHAAVVYAVQGNDAGAAAWTFSASG